MKWQLSAKGGGAEDQCQLDVGQKRFGATQCPECNVVYQLGDPEDENAHLNYHNSIRTLKFQVRRACIHEINITVDTIFKYFDCIRYFRDGRTSVLYWRILSLPAE